MAQALIQAQARQAVQGRYLLAHTKELAKHHPKKKDEEAGADATEPAESPLQDIVLTKDQVKSDSPEEVQVALTAPSNKDASEPF